VLDTARLQWVSEYVVRTYTTPPYTIVCSDALQPKNVKTVLVQSECGSNTYTYVLTC